MDNSDSDHQPSHSTENTLTNEPTDCNRKNDYVNWKRLSYVTPSAVTVPTRIPTIGQPSSSFPSATAVPSRSTAVLQPRPTHFNLQDVAQLPASTEKDHLPKWKLSQHNGDPIQWHEWFGQFKGATDSAQLTDPADLSEKSGNWNVQSRNSRIRLLRRYLQRRPKGS